MHGAKFKPGLPPAGTKAGWLLLRSPDADGVNKTEVALGVFDGNQWCKTDKWDVNGKAWAATPVAQKLGCEILGWLPFEVPVAELEPAGSETN